MVLVIHFANSKSEQSPSSQCEAGYIINLKVAKHSEQGQLQIEKALAVKEIFPMKWTSWDPMNVDTNFRKFSKALFLENNPSLEKMDHLHLCMPPKLCPKSALSVN